MCNSGVSACTHSFPAIFLLCVCVHARAREAPYRVVNAFSFGASERVILVSGHVLIYVHDEPDQDLNEHSEKQVSVNPRAMRLQ